MRPSPTKILAVGLLSAGTLLAELALTRLFAVAQFYHFAFLVISLALLGFGAAGSLLAIRPRLKARDPAGWMIGFALSIVIGYAVMNVLPFDSYAIASDRREIPKLLLTLAAASTPFFFSGLVVGALLAQDVSGAHRIYAANLAGSAAGCALALPALDAVGGEGALLLAAGLGALGAALVGRRWLRVAGAGLALALAALAVGLPPWATVQLSPYKALSQALLTPDAQYIFSEWDQQARVDVVESGAIHQMPGLSLSAGIARPPVQMGLTLDGDNLTAITLLSPEDPLAHTLAANVPQYAAYLLNPDADVLILSPRGGWDVLMALSSGAARVVAVEDDALVLAVVGELSGGLYDDPRVQTVHKSGRTFAHRSREDFDVIVLALTDSFHPVTSGAFSLSEDYRYTVEAMEDYLARLRPGGTLVVMRWLQMPPTESVRVAGAAAEALRRRGIESPGDYIAAYRDIRTLTLLVSPSPLDAAARQTLRDFTDSRGYDLVWLPDIQPDEVNRHNILPSPDDYEAFRALLADPEAFLRDNDYDVRPATDDRPFFFHFFRWRQTPELLATLGHTWQPFGGSGYLVLVALLALVTVAAAVLILTPVALARVGRVRWDALVYFFALGLGFLFVEMPLAQQFIVFLGQPVTALAAVLFAVLLASGLGSLTAPRWSLPVAMGALVVAVAVYPWLLRGLFSLALGWPLAARLAAAGASLTPLGVLMGVPFARGLALFEARVPGVTPWAWAVNGSASVISSVLAVMIAMSAGLSVVLWLGAGIYAIAWLAAVRLTRPSPRA
jgi:hypothetical protein